MGVLDNSPVNSPGTLPLACPVPCLRSAGSSGGHQESDVTLTLKHKLPAEQKHPSPLELSPQKQDPGR